jgi:hypothetical protein
VTAEVGVVVALPDQLDEGIDRHQRVLDLVGDAGHDAGEELELLRLAALGGQLLLRREVLEDEDGAEGFSVLVPHRVGRDFQPQATQRQLDLRAGGRPARGERVIQHVAQGRGEHPKILAHDGGGRQVEDLLGAAVQGAHGLVTTDRHHPARHVREDPLAELLLPGELVVQRDVAQDGGQMGGQIEQRLHLVATVGGAEHRLAERQHGHQLSVREQRDRHHCLE